MPSSFSIRPTNFPHGVTSQGQLVLTQQEVGVSAPVIGLAFHYGDNVGTDGSTFLIENFAGSHEMVVMITGAGAATINTPTAAQIIAAIPTWEIGGIYRLRLCNPTNGAITVAPGAGVTITGLSNIPTNKWREWLVRYTGAGAVNLRDIGSGDA